MTTHMQIVKIRDAYYELLLSEPNHGYDKDQLIKGRASDYVQPRAAILVALSNRFRPFHIGKALGIHHTTVLYHRLRHEGNVLSWNGYTPLYDMAEELMSKAIVNEKFSL